MPQRKYPRSQLLLAVSSKSHNLLLVMGNRDIQTLNGARASSTALAMAAGAGTAPPSPTGLAPKTVSDVGILRCSTMYSGISLAVIFG